MRPPVDKGPLSINFEAAICIKKKFTGKWKNWLHANTRR